MRALLGEFHIYRADADLPEMRKAVEPAKKSGPYPDSHSKAAAVTRHFQQDSAARVLWAHSGFKRPEKVREMLRRKPALWCDRAFLTSHASPDVGRKIAYENGDRRFESKLGGGQ